MASKCCNAETHIGYYNDNPPESSAVIAMMGTFCNKCDKLCDYTDDKGNEYTTYGKLKNKKAMTGIELIAKERREQIEKHGRTTKTDVYYNSKGCSYDARIMPLVCGAIELIDPNFGHQPAHWDDSVVKHMNEKPIKERLIMAAALLAAEIDRLDYIEHEKTKENA